MTYLHFACTGLTFRAAAMLFLYIQETPLRPYFLSTIVLSDEARTRRYVLFVSSILVQRPALYKQSTIYLFTCLGNFEHDTVVRILSAIFTHLLASTPVCVPLKECAENPMLFPQQLAFLKCLHRKS
jgi:hypothetical protein